MMNKTLISIISLMVVPLSGLAVDIYVPSLPDMATFFHVNPSYAQLTITIYLAGYAISQLIAGVVCDVFGRKISTVVSLGLFTLSGFGIVATHNVYTVLMLRFVQGFLVGFFAVAQRAIIVDIFKHDEKKMHTMVNYVIIAWSIGPIIAPVIGGYLQHMFNWQANFIFLFSYSGLVFLLVLFFVPETLEKRVKLDLAYMKDSYKTILGTKGYNLGFTCNGLLYIMSISFSTVGAFLVERKMGYSPVMFGYCALLLGGAWFAGQMLNKVLQNYSIERKILVATRINVFVTLIALIWSLISFNLVELVLPLIFLNLSSAIVFGNYFIRNSTMFPKFAGNAGSLQAAGLLIITSIGGTIVNKVVSTTSTTPLMITYLIIAVACFFITRMINFNQVKHTHT